MKNMKKGGWNRTKHHGGHHVSERYLFIFMVLVFLSFLAFNINLFSENSLTGAVIGITAVPTVDTIAINTTFPDTNDTTQNITAHVTTSDGDGDPVRVIYNWFMNNTSIAVVNMPFEGDGVNNATDYSGYDNNGTPAASIGVPPVWNRSFGVLGGGAFNFTTTDQYINIGLSTFSAEEGTMAIWIFSNELAIGADKWIFARNQGGNVNGDIGFEWVDINDTLIFFIQNGTHTAAPSALLSFQNDTANWHFLAGTWNASETAFYLDGVKQSTTIGIRLNAHASGFKFGIGNINGGDALAQSFPGLLDEAIIFNRTLSEKQILALYQNKTDLIVAQETSVGDQWNFSATPNDKSSDGTAKFSNGVTIQAVADCGYVNADLILTTNLEVNDTCFVINASNLVIDGGDFTVTGNATGDGFNITGFNNTTFKNITFFNFSVGGFVSGGENNTFTNLTMDVTTSYGYQLDTSADRNNISENVIKNTTDSAVFFNQADQNIVEENTIIINDVEAVYVQTSDSNNITNNIVTLTGSISTNLGLFYLTGTAADNQFVNNTANSTRQAGHGLFVEGNHRTQIINNTFFTNASNANGIYIKGGQNNNTFRGNIISIYGTNGDAVLFDGSSNNIVDNNSLTVEADFGHGISFETSAGQNNLFTRNNVQVSGADSHAVNFVTASSANNASFINNILNSSSGNFTFAQLTNSGVDEIYYLNNTGNKSTVDFHINNKGKLIFQWYVVANVTNSSGALNNVNVTGFNITGLKEDTNNTSADGFATLVLTEFVQNRSDNIVYETPHTINTSLAAYNTNTTTVNLSQTESTQLNIQLSITESDPPAVTINTPTPGYYNDSIRVNATVTDASSVSEVNFRYENSSTNGSWTTMSQEGNDWNGTFSLTGISDGNYTIRVNATDSVGNENSTEFVGNVSIDTTAPDKPQLFAPVNSSTASATTVAFRWEVNDSLASDLTCEITLDGLLNETGISVQNGTGKEVNISGLSEATHNWNVSCNDSVPLTNVSDTFVFTISLPSTGGSTSGGGVSTGGTVAGTTTRTQETREAEPAPTSLPRSFTQPVATPEELRRLLAENIFSIAVTADEPAIIRGEYARRQALTGRAARASRQIARIPLAQIRKVRVTFTNRGNQPVSITPAVRDEVAYRLPEEANVREILTRQESPEIIEEKIDTLRRIEDQDIRYVARARVVAPTEGLLQRLTGDATALLSYSPGIPSGKFLRAEVIDPEEITVGPGETLEREFDVRVPITKNQRPVNFTFKTENVEVYQQVVDIAEVPRIGTAVDVDVQQQLLELYMIIPEDPTYLPESEYTLELSINPLDGKTSSYAEIFGPYYISGAETRIFTQGLRYNPVVYYGIHPIVLKITLDGVLVAENEFMVDFGTGIVKEVIEQAPTRALVGSAIWQRVRTAATAPGLIGLIILAIVIVLLLTLQIIKTMRRDGISITAEEIPELPAKEKAKAKEIVLADWTPGKRLPLVEELAAVNEKLNTLRVVKEKFSAGRKNMMEEVQQSRQELRKTLQQLAKRRPSLVLEKPEQHKELAASLAAVESELAHLDRVFQKKQVVLSEIPATKGHTTQSDKERRQVERTLARLTSSLKDPLRTLRPRRPSEDEVKAQEEALAEVRRIARKIERNRRVPANELLEIERQLQEIPIAYPRNAKVRTTIPTTGGHTLSTTGESRRITKRLRQIETALQGPLPSKAEHSDLRAELDTARAQREVQRIARKLEGKKPKPSNELHEIEQKLAKLRKDIEEK